MALLKTTFSRLPALRNALFSNNKLHISTTPTTCCEKNEMINSCVQEKVMDKWEILNPEKAKRAKLMRTEICVDDPQELVGLRDNPLNQVGTRLLRIHQPTKNAMQSGTNNTSHWEIDFNNQERWENPLMGWCANGDPLSSLVLRFETKQEAICYCRTYGYSWYVQEKLNEKPFKPKDYAEIFSWNKRTRSSTK